MTNAVARRVFIALTHLGDISDAQDSPVGHHRHILDLLQTVGTGAEIAAHAPIVRAIAARGQDMAQPAHAPFRRHQAGDQQQMSPIALDLVRQRHRLRPGAGQVERQRQIAEQMVERRQLGRTRAVREAIFPKIADGIDVRRHDDENP